eukprot:Polyplicarium_translucidae@DN2676_c0_g1_i4.p1
MIPRPNGMRYDTAPQWHAVRYRVLMACGTIPRPNGMCASARRVRILEEEKDDLTMRLDGMSGQLHCLRDQLEASKRALSETTATLRAHRGAADTAAQELHAAKNFSSLIDLKLNENKAALMQQVNARQGAEDELKDLKNHEARLRRICRMQNKNIDGLTRKLILLCKVHQDLRDRAAAREEAQVIASGNDDVRLLQEAYDRNESSWAAKCASLEQSLSLSEKKFQDQSGAHRRALLAKDSEIQVLRERLQSLAETQ